VGTYASVRALLKGGFALELRLAGRARATKDVYIDWQADEELLLETLIDAAAQDAGDYFTFTIERAGAPENRLGGSHRFRASASLAGRLFETFLLDVGFRGEEEVTADTLTTEALLAFAEIPPVEVLAVPLELQVAEKLHAYTRTYEGGRPSTRPDAPPILCRGSCLSPLRIGPRSTVASPSGSKLTGPTSKTASMRWRFLSQSCDAGSVCDWACSSLDPGLPTSLATPALDA
jgi:hypothetical protein